MIDDEMSGVQPKKVGACKVGVLESNFNKSLSRKVGLGLLAIHRPERSGKVMSDWFVVAVV